MERTILHWALPLMNISNEFPLRFNGLLPRPLLFKLLTFTTYTFQKQYLLSIQNKTYQLSTGTSSFDLLTVWYWLSSYLYHLKYCCDIPCHWFITYGLGLKIPANGEIRGFPTKLGTEPSCEYPRDTSLQVKAKESLPRNHFKWQIQQNGCREMYLKKASRTNAERIA